MTYYAELDNKDKTGGDVATTNGWNRFCEWIESLALGDLPQLRHFIEYGWSQELDGLLSDLRIILTCDPNESNESIARGLIGVLEAKADAEVIVLTDGV